MPKSRKLILSTKVKVIILQSNNQLIKVIMGKYRLKASVRLLKFNRLLAINSTLYTYFY